MTPEHKHIADRDWPEDFAMENGNYMCRCCLCKETFAGHKRRIICKLCDQPNAKAAPEPEQGEAVEVVVHMYQHEETGLIGFVDQQQVDWGFEKNNPRLHLCGPLMTVAQHNRIMAAAKPEADMPYAFEYGKDNGDGTYSVTITRGAIPSYMKPVKDWPVKPLYTAPPSPDAELVELLVIAAGSIREICKERGAPLPNSTLNRIDAKLAELRKAAP